MTGGNHVDANRQSCEVGCSRCGGSSVRRRRGPPPQRRRLGIDVADLSRLREMGALRQEGTMRGAGAQLRRVVAMLTPGLHSRMLPWSPRFELAATPAMVYADRTCVGSMQAAANHSYGASSDGDGRNGVVGRKPGSMR